MDREHIKGAADKAKGTIKQGAGKLSGDKELEHEGKADKAKPTRQRVTCMRRQATSRTLRAKQRTA